MRMARMQVYLPDDLYAQVKARGLLASELLQRAVRAELRRLDLLAEADRYVEEVTAEYGPPTAEEIAYAEDLARRIARVPARRAS
jgi:post-segregation antitoxin (ccd killing protein)